MFLKKYLSKLLYPSYCIYCSISLEKSTLFCEPCQRVLVQEFDSNEMYLDPYYGKMSSLFLASQTSKSLFRLFQNPQNRFLSKALASLYILKLQEIPDFWPDYLLSLKGHPLSSSSPTFEIQRSLSQILKIPLKRFKSLKKMEATEKKILVVCIDYEELKRYQKQLILLRKEGRCELLVLLGQSISMRISDKDT